MTTESIRCPQCQAANNERDKRFSAPREYGERLIATSSPEFKRNASIEALVEALRPFAIAANDAHVRNCECEEALVGAGGLTAGDLRRARTVLERLGVRL